MRESLEIRLEDWPNNPGDVRDLYLDETASEKLASSLIRRGWNVIDIRIMPNETDADKAKTIKAKLEGIRVGSIEADATARQYLELEAKMYGLLNNKQANTDVQKAKTDDVMGLLKSFGGSAYSKSTKGSQTGYNKTKSNGKRKAKAVL